MEKKTRIVIFTDNNARIITTRDPGKYKLASNMVVDPDLTQVRHVPPHFWKLKQGLVLEMSRPEKLARMEVIERSGADNSIRFIELKKIRMDLKRHVVTKRYYKIASILLLISLAASWGWVLWQT